MRFTHQFVIELLRSDDSVLVKYAVTPGAWSGEETFTPHRFAYQGDGSGDVRVAFQATDLAVHLSQARTRVENRSVVVTPGGELWTNTFPPVVMFTVLRDTYGTHDLLYPLCCRYALEKRFSVSRDGCLENLVQALQEWGVQPHEIPDPLNLFFRVSVDDRGGMEVQKPTSPPGSAIELRAEMDCIVAVATCSVPFPGKENSEYHIEIVG